VPQCSRKLVIEGVLKTTLQPDAATGEKLATVPRYGSKADVAAMLQMSRRTVDNLLRQGCPHLKLGSRRCRFDLAEVREWLSENFRVQRRGKLVSNGGGQ
jgi:predicted DNA-binding transcriptional regulator AlpA